MSEISYLADLLEAGYDGEPWHGPSLRDALEGITAEQAAAHPIPGAHSVWELVHHLAAGDNMIVGRVNGKALDLPEEGEFPSADPSGREEDWRAMLDALDAAHARLVATMRTLSDADLDRPTPARDFPLRFMFHGTLQHLAYHAAQVNVLRKALAA